jgi:hypothetical protein
MQATDLAPVYIVSEIDPPIQPYIAILPNLEFSGEGACNTFSGTYTYQPDELTSMDLAHSMDDCGISIHNNFESDYFFFMEYFWFTIIPDGNGLSLEIGNPLFGYAVFKDYELSVNEYELSAKIKVYPNPVSDILNITSEKVVIESVSVYSLAGQQLISPTENFENIDVSSLSEGIYLLEIYTENGRQVQKFIKE